MTIKNTKPNAFGKFQKALRSSGFTLAELIVVIAILAVLATIGFLTLSGYREDAKNSVIKANVRTVYSAIMAESTATQTSARCFIKHDPTYSLTWGAMVVFDGSKADDLKGGPCGVEDTNYSVGNPDYRALKMNPDKFRITFNATKKNTLVSFLSQWNPVSAEEADPALLLVGAADLEDASSGKTRIRSFAQVAAILEGDVSYVTWDFPTGWTEDGSVWGLIKDKAYASSTTGALIDSAPTGSPAPCAATNISGYEIPDLTSGQSVAVEKNIDHGKWHTTATCSYGISRIDSESATCDTDYVASSPAPSCVIDSCTGNFPSHALANGTPGTAAWGYSEQAGVCKFSCEAGYTWDGNSCNASCELPNSVSYSGLNYTIPYASTIVHGASTTESGTTVFGTDPANGELSASFAFSCVGGTLTTVPTAGTGSCTRSNYTFNNDFSAPVCSANTQSFTCAAKPATGTVWNTVSAYTQTWDGNANAGAGAWTPADSTPTYNTVASTTECRYQCDTGYSYIDGTCKKICKFDDPGSTFDNCVFAP